jgi:hypothetical protein
MLALQNVKIALWSLWQYMSSSTILREYYDNENQDVEIQSIMKAATIIRREILEQKSWTFTGSFNNYQTPCRL